MKHWYEKPTPPQNPLVRAIRTALFWAECAIIAACVLYAAFETAMFALLGMARILSGWIGY